MSESAAASEPATGLLDFLTGYLRSSEPRFLVVYGNPGAGKSTLLRRLRADKLDSSALLLYQQPAAPPPGDGGAMPPVAMLFLQPPDAPDRARADAGPKPAPLGPPGVALPEPLERASSWLEAAPTTAR